MPSPLEHASASFTEEAEAAVQKALQRIERRLRGKALEEAMRTRGWPLEVTASDVHRAEFEWRPRRDSSNSPRERALLRFSEDKEGALLSNLGARNASRKPKRLLDVLALAYQVIGLFFAIAGLVYAPLLKRVSSLLHDPNWRRGLTLSLVGSTLFLMSALVRWMQKKVSK
jgi:hypothetical protein